MNHAVMDHRPVNDGPSGLASLPEAKDYSDAKPLGAGRHQTLGPRDLASLP